MLSKYRTLWIHHFWWFHRNRATIGKRAQLWNVAFADSGLRHVTCVDSSVAVKRAVLPHSFNLPFLDTLCSSDYKLSSRSKTSHQRFPLVHPNNFSDSLQIDYDANKLLIVNREMRMAGLETVHVVHDVRGILIMKALFSVSRTILVDSRR